MRPHPLRNRPARWAALLLALATPQLMAEPTRNSISNPGGYVSTCIAASTNGVGFNPGDAITVNYAAGNCSSDLFSGSGGSASAQHFPVAGDNITGGATGSVSLGQIHLGSQYSLQQGGNSPSAAAVGGFKTTMTANISDPSLLGTSGFLLFDLAVSGGLKSQGIASGAAFMLQAYLGNNPLMTAYPGFNLGTGIEASTDRQMAVWRVESFPLFETDTQSVDEVLTFSVPVIFGDPFELGIFATSISAGRNSEGTGSAQSDFSHTAYWGGVRGARNLAGGLIDATVTIASKDGIDWTRSQVPTTPPGTVPTPASLPLVLAGITLAAVATTRRRHPVN